jgi:hypothetical protein
VSSLLVGLMLALPGHAALGMKATLRVVRRPTR